LSPHNCHRNAAKIAKVGPDLKELRNAVAMELAPQGQLREEHISFNNKLISRSQGLLAPATGCERYLSLGCGHTVAFAKAAGAGGKTPEVSLQDVHGNIDTNALCANATFKTMSTVGWDWIIIPWEIDNLFPEWAGVAQSALNASNNVASLMSELEVAVNFSSAILDPGLKDEAKWEAKVIDSISSLCAPCAPYADKILKYTQNFGGGDDAKLIAFMDDVAKTYGCNPTMGAAWWTAMAESVFAQKGEEHPLVRTAMHLANLTGDKVDDGISRTLAKSDMQKICGKACTKAVNELNLMLRDALAISESMVHIR